MTSQKDAAAGDDMAVSDLTLPHDLTVPPDLSIPPDLATPPDLTVVDLRTPVDLAKGITPPDLAGVDGGIAPPPKCAANAGYGSTNKPDGGFSVCGQQGTCGGNTYTLDCNGFTCVCAINKQQTAMVVEMFDSCQKLNDVWTNACGF